MTESRTRLQRAEELFHRVASLPEELRAAEITRLAGRDRALSADVRSLLAHSSRMQGFLERPALGVAFDLAPVLARSAAEDAESEDEMLGQTVGRYRIERRIGSGGMATVYEAARADREFTKRVALKLVKRGMDSEEILRRFRRERDTLAGLEHASIARLVDGGITSSGQPYMVMELVEGEPIDAFCDNRRATLRERLELFLVVCDAVQHAHRNLVVHRDLKPSNILVTADGAPKLLDFGISTVLDPSGRRTATLAAERRLTPAYASPELLAGSAVTTASDVYSLGVILCELVCGRGPHGDDIRTVRDAERAIADGPRAPSELVRAAPLAERVENARARRAAPEQLVRALRGDLDTIVHAALRREPERRYPSVERLAADVRAYLERRPVSARRDTLVYRAGKFVRRHALATALAALSFALFTAGAATYAWQGRAVREQRDEALLARARWASITGFLERMLEAPDPAIAGPSVTVRQVLDEAAVTLDGELTDQPLVQASLRGTIGRTYLALGLFREAERELRTAHHQKTELLGARQRETALAACDLASALYALEEHGSAAGLLQEAVEVFRSTGGELDADLARALGSLGAVRRAQGDTVAAERLQREALEVRTRIGGRSTLEVAESLNNLAGALAAEGRDDEALPLLEEALDIRRAAFGEAHPLVAQSMDNLAEILQHQGLLDEAEALRREALAIEIEILGPDHPDVAVTRRNLARLVLARGEPDEAERLLRLSLAAREKSLAPSSVLRVETQIDLAQLLLRRGEREQTKRLIETALEVTRTLDARAPARVLATTKAIELYRQCGELQRSEELRAQLSSAADATLVH